MAHGMNANKHNAHPFSERRFERFITRIDNKPVGCRRLICATPSCGQEGEILDRTNEGLPPAVIERRFTQKGWEVGKNPKHDFCPSCVEARTIERRQRRNGNKVKSFTAIGNVFPLTPAETPPQPEQGEEVQATAESPIEMSRSDKRLIFAKLEECYESEDIGYKPGWTDQTLAKDMGVPAAWVAKVREENFGPVKDNAEIRDMLVRVGVAATDAKKLLEEARAHRTAADTVVKSNNELMDRCTELGKTLSGLLTIADRIAKALK